MIPSMHLSWLLVPAVARSTGYREPALEFVQWSGGEVRDSDMSRGLSEQPPNWLDVRLPDCFGRRKNHAMPLLNGQLKQDSGSDGTQNQCLYTVQDSWGLGKHCYRMSPNFSRQQEGNCTRPIRTSASRDHGGSTMKRLILCNWKRFVRLLASVYQNGFQSG